MTVIVSDRKVPFPIPIQVDALRLRLEEKETTLNKKSKQIQEMSEEKGTLNGEIHDLKDMLEVKERKVNVLQKKVIWTLWILIFFLVLFQRSYVVQSDHKDVFITLQCVSCD